MEYNKKLYLILLISSLVVSIGWACDQDWQCGNNLPFQQCKKNITIPIGIDVDSATGRVVFIASYVGDQFKRLLSIPIEGGPIKYEYTLFGESFYSRFYHLYRYLSTSKQLYVVTNEIRYNSLAAYLPSTGSVGFQRYYKYPFEMQFDEQAQKTYYCDYLAVRKVNFIPVQKVDDLDKQSQILYGDGQTTFGVCTNIALLGQDLYVLTTSSGPNKIFRGSVNGSPLVEVLVEGVNQYITQFQATTTHFIYIVNNDIVKVPINGDISQKKVLVKQQGTYNQVSFRVYGGYVYFTSGNQILRIPYLQDGPAEIIYNGNKVNGDCLCAEGYSGDNCQQCDASTHIISWVNGKPQCVPLTSNGLPSQCTDNYQCNEPYGQCAGFSDIKVCACQTNFFGQKCQQCNGTVTWFDGKPSCNPNA
ncbi:hypothetical protein DLAC_05761 [Tieghemostelium lacteum]|uniref:EGF-like domain-containing protein n=1 Tax=Tieghemostelium lacteum TaxID=361077 RepID=A0A151ZGN5_TIELA|nr:hypothetical protein DLAC_05761 [Tieghemostelium lacteum]|eukprot:KYQ93132.1 hypothetical protein DLAC_05761 [Tieghemostelium lacteum]